MLKFIRLLFKVLRKTKLSNLIPSKLYLKLFFYVNMGKKLNLKNPSTFNEKLNWLKLYNKNPLYTKMVDKIEVKTYIKDKLGDSYNIRILNIYEKTKEIDFESLPDKFVLKCNHNSQGGICICKNKDLLDYDKVIKLLNKAMKQNYYYHGREWPYKNVKRKVFAEEFIEDGRLSLIDYKFFCFNGYVDSVMVCVGRYQKGGTKFYFMDKNRTLKKYNFSSLNPNFIIPFDKPDNFDEMLNIASRLSKGIPFVRIDLYSVKDRIYFGEFTFFPESGIDSNLLPEADLYLGQLIDLNLSYNFTEDKKWKQLDL